MNRLVFVFVSLFVSSALSFSQPRNLEDFFNIIGLGGLRFPDPVSPTSSSNSTASTTYAYTAWSNYSECDKVCGGGMMERTRRCLANGQHEVYTTKCSSIGGRPSPLDLVRRYLKGSDYTIEIQQKPCNNIACLTTAWGDWGPCDKVCGDGTQYTSRTCLESKDQSQCNFQRTKSRSCNNGNCFRLSNWSEWGHCSRDCGVGVKKRTRRCEPAISSNHTEYATLTRVINIVKSGRYPHIFLSQSPSLFYYFIQYSSDCRGTLYDSGACNTFACPTCPFNQEHYSCKPCVHRCSDVSQASSLLMSFNPFPSSANLAHYLHSHVTGCNNVCEAGCGCPLFSPLLGADQRCYPVPILCPRPVVVGSIGTSTIPGRNFASTTIPTETVSTTAPAVETTTVDLIDEEQGPLEEEQEEEPVDPRSEVIPVEVDNRPDCQNDVLIATKPGPLTCKCNGRLKTLPCFSTDGTTCPVICYSPPVQRVCPPVDSAAVLSTRTDCSDQCSTDSDCGVGDLCCNTSCGMNCLGSVVDSDEE